VRNLPPARRVTALPTAAAVVVVVVVVDRW
jgi:hypothetical protein